MNLIEIRHLTFRYPGSDKKVLDDLNFAIKENEITSLFGPNGSGKSTLLHLIAKLEKNFEGSINYHPGGFKTRIKLEKFKHVGFLPQIEFINPMLTVFDYVLLGRSPYVSIGKLPEISDRECAWNSLKSLYADHAVLKRIGEISGGQLQLVRLARVFAQQAGFILLDEPTTFLDSSNKLQLIRILRELTKNKITVILASHDPEFIKELKSKVLLLQNGKIVRQGPLSHLFTGINDQHHISIQKN